MSQAAAKQQQNQKKDNAESRSNEINRAAMHGYAQASERARSSFGNNGGIDFDANSPFDVRCRVGVWENVVLTRSTPKRRKAGNTKGTVRSLRVRGSGPSWDKAFDEARNNRDRDDRR